MKAKDSELIADIYWWISGYMSGTETCPFRNEHLEALANMVEIARKQEEIENAKP